MPHTDNVSLYVVGGFAVVLIGILSAVMRAITRGDLVPRSTMDSRLADRDAEIARITAWVDAQAAALEAASILTAEQTRTIATQAGSISDFGEAQRLNVRVANALHNTVAADAGGE